MVAVVDEVEVIAPLLKLDIGCGKHKKAGFLGVDQIAFEGVDTVIDVRLRWPWADGSVEEVHCSHFLEHLTAQERIHFVNELHRVLVTGGKAAIITPHWASNRAYGDPTHQWPPVAEMWFYYLDPTWREENAPHTDARWTPGGFSCHFDATWSYGMHPMLQTRNQEFQQWALNFYREAAQDLHATVTKR
jgi:hypothetical protein